MSDQPSQFLRNKIRQAADASARGDSDGTRRHLEHATAEDPDAIRHIATELRRHR